MSRKRTHRVNHTPSMFESLESRQMMSAGDLDPTFGAGGKVIAQATGFPVTDVAVQRNGQIIAVGSLNNDFAVARLNADGKLDRSFGGGDGIASADFGGDRGDDAKTVAIQPDGKIVIGGHMNDTSFTTLADVSGFAIARFNTDGSLDKSFDGDGKVVIDTAGADRSFASALAIQPDGKIVAAGIAGTRGRFAPPNDADDFVVARLLPNGRLDNTFGVALPVVLSGTTVRTGMMTIGFGAGEGEGANAIALMPDGRMVIGGNGGPNKLTFAIARLSANGTLDKSFGDGISGAWKFNNLFPDGAKLVDLAVQPDGGVVAVGGRNGNFSVARLTPQGRLDPNFAGTGHVDLDFAGNDEAQSVQVSREGILVAGGSGGKFALARFRNNGALDTTFGQGGKVITTTVNGDAILNATLQSDGKILAVGRSGSSARYIAAVPKVNVFSLDPDGAEGKDNPASLIFTRDIRASFATRVFFDLDGTATFNADYTGPTTKLVADLGNVTPLGGLITRGILHRVGFVDIPANETTAIVPINVVDDKLLESAETVQATIRADAAYTLGDRTSQTVDLADNDIVRVNFQVATNVTAFGYVPDLGLPFGARDTFGKYDGPLNFGWDVDNRANARDRGLALPGYTYDTFNHMQKPGGGSKWEFTVPNGMYEVKLAAGDPAAVDSVYKMNLEGQLALSGTPGGATHWFERTVRVAVNDGRLTLSNAAGAQNNKIAFIEIQAAARGAKAGPVTDNLPVQLPGQKPSPRPAQSRQVQHDRIFSEIAI